MASPFDLAREPPWNSSSAFDAARNAPLSGSSEAFDAARPQAPPEDQIQSTPYDRLTSVYGNEFTKGLRRGALGIVGTTEGFAAQAVEPFSTKLSNQLFDEANRTLDFEEGLRPKVPTWEDVHGIGSFFDYGLGKAGEALPSTAASLAAAGVGGAAGLGLRAAGLQAAGRLPLSFAAGSLSMLPQEGGESAISLHNDPRAMARTTPWERLGVSSVKGGVNAALEFAPEAIALNRAFKAPAIRRGLGRALAETGLGAAEATTGEAITEGLQEKTGQIAQSYANPQRDTSQDTANIREAMLGGAFGGVGMGALGGGIHALRSNVLPQPGEEAPPAPPPPPAEGGGGLFNFVSNLGHSVNQKLRQSDEWSEAKGKDLELLQSNPEFAEVLNKLPVGEQRAVVGTLHAIRAAPNLLDSEGGKTANDLLNSYFGDNSLNRLSAAIQQPGNEKVSHLGPSAIDQPRDANTLGKFKGYTEEGEQRDAEQADDEKQTGFLNDILPEDKLGINRDILSAALQNRAHYRYGEATPSDKAMTDIPLKFTSSDGTMSAQDFIRSLTTRDFKPGEREQVREHTDAEVAYHSKDGSAELPISPMSLVTALSTAYKDQLGDLREGQTGYSGQRKGDLFMSALSTLLNDGISITDAEGKPHHFNVEVGDKAKVGKNGDLPDNLLIHHDSQTGGYTIGDYKREGGKLYGAADAEALTLERGLIEQFAPLADDQKAWDNLYFKIKKEAPFGSPLNKALWKVGQNKDNLDVLLGKNIRNTVSNGLRTIKDDVDDIVNGLAEQTDGNPSQLLDELQDYLGSDGANEPSSAVKKLFSDNNVPLFTHETLSSEALQNEKGLRPQDSFLKNIEYLHNRATENYNFGLLSETESNEGKNAEVSNVPGIGNAVWGTAGKPKIINKWTGELGKRVTEQTKASLIQGHRNYQNIISTHGPWRIEAEGGQRAGFFKTQKEAEQFINDLPAGGFQILYKKYPYSIEKAKKKWPGWKEKFGETKKPLSTDQVSIFNPETGEILSLAGQDFKNLPPETAIQYLQGINKTLARGTKLSAVDTTPMHTTAEAMPADVAQLVHDRELRGESVTKLREAYAGTSRPLTAADLEKGIQTVPEEVQTKPAPSERTARGGIEQSRSGQAAFDLQSEQDLEDVRTQLSIERERKVDKNPALIKELEAEEARLVKYTPEGRVDPKTIQYLEDVRARLATERDPALKKELEAEEAQLVKRISRGRTPIGKPAATYTEGEYAERGVTDDFGNRILPPKPEKEVTPREQRLQDLAADKAKRLRQEEHYTRSVEEEEAAIKKVREEKGSAAARKERARIETLRTNKRDRNLVTGRKSAGELEAAGELDKPDTMAPHAKRHKELSEKAKVKAEAEATAKARREGVEPGNILFTTSTAADYITRTGANANADATIALAVDFDSPGEKATKRLVKQKSKTYVPINYNGEEKATDEQVKAAVDALNEIPKQEISLNIAGNGIVTLNEQGHGDQAKIDAYTQDFLERVLDHPDLKKKVTSVRTGGQTGFDEAGAKAAQYLGIPVEVHAPRNWMFRVVDKSESSGYRDIKNEAQFKARFKQPEKSGVAHEVSQPEKAAATYEAEQKQRETEVAADVADRDKPPSVRAFDNYVKSGRYSQWYRDSVERVGKEKTDEMSREIREYRLSQIPELKDANIGVDGSTIVNIPENVKAQLRSGVDGRISRLMVGNHGVYVEFVPTKEMTGGKVHLQYVEHKDAAGNKLYEQTRKVNYADYRVGRWYVAATDILGKTAPITPTTTQAPAAVTHEEPMTFPMPANTNVTGKATTTFQLVKDGLRTATTRHWGRLPKVGDIISFYNRGKTDTVKVRVTNVSPRLSVLFEGKDKNDVLTELSKAEGWTPEAFIDHYDNGKGATVNDNSRQVTYELVDKPAAPAAPLPPLSSMVKRGRTHPSQMPPRSIKQRAEAKRALAAAQLEGRRARAAFINTIRGMGGISTREASDIAGEKGFRANQLGGGIFRSDGHAMDLVADKLYEQGYISEEEHEDVDGGVQRARDLIKEALEGGIVAPIGRLEEILGNIRAAEELATEPINTGIQASANALAPLTTAKKYTRQQAQVMLEPIHKTGNLDTALMREVFKDAEGITDADREFLTELDDIETGKYNHEGIAQRTVDQWSEKFANGEKVQVIKLPANSVVRKMTNAGASAGAGVGAVAMRVNGKSYLATFEGSKSPETALSRLSHEFGHALQKIAFENAPQHVKDALLAQHKADMEELLKDPKQIQRFLSGARLDQKSIDYIKSLLEKGATMEDVYKLIGQKARADAYLTSFEEWFAEQFSKYVTSSEDMKMTPELRTFWEKMYDKFKQYFDEVVKALKPNETFASWVDSLADPTKTFVITPPKVSPSLVESLFQSAKEHLKRLGEATAPGAELAKQTAQQTWKGLVDHLAKVNKASQVVQLTDEKQSTQSTPTPGVAQPSTTQAATAQLIQTLVEKMFGKKVAVVFGIPNMTKNRKARGWYEGRSKLNELKANEAKLEQVRNKRREALAAGDQQEVAAMDAREQRLLRQEEVLGTIYLNPNNSIREMLPTFYHEAVHAAFDILLSPAERAILGTAFSHGTVRRQLEKIFANDAGVLAQMKDAEEAAAYGFQIHAVAPHMLQISDNLAAIFAKVAKWFREMTGALSAEDKAEIIMNDMLAGRLAGNGMSAVQTVLAADQTTQQKIAKHITVVREMLQKMWDVIASPSYKRLIDTGNPALIAFAKAGHTKTGEHGDLGMIQRMQTEISARFNWVDKIQSKYTHDQLQAVAEHRMKSTYPTDPTLQRAYKDVDTFFNEFKKYADDAKMNIGFIKNYWPMMWDAAKVIANKADFLAMVSQPKYAAEMAALKATPEELYENISSYVTRGDSFQNIMSPSGEPANAYSKERSLSFLEYDDRKQFMHDDPVQTMVNYTSNMIRQAEYVRKYGQGGALRDAMLKEAKEKYGATDTQISLAKDYLDGLLGNKEVGMSRELKDIYGAIAVYQNYRLLSFNLFSSLMDPWGIAIRSGRLADGLETFIYSLKNIFRDLKKNRPDADKDMWEKLALDWGYIEDAGTMSSLRHMMETTELRGFSKKMNDALFKWNLLNGWTRSTKIMAVKAGQRFMARIAQGNSSHDARHLKELGLTAADIMPTTEGNIALRKDEFVAQGMSEANAIKQEAKMREAMTKFVNQAILNPTAADLPNWGSNPYWAPIFHLKQFMFTFQTTILDRIWHEAKEGNLKPLWIATIYIPGTIAAEALRGFVSNFGKQPPWQKDWGPVDYVKNGYARSGLMGTGQLFASIQDDIMHGGAGYESAVGPMVEQFYKGLRAVAKGDTSFFNFVVKSMPLNQIYDQWLLTHHTGPMGKHYGPNAAPATSK